MESQEIRLPGKIGLFPLLMYSFGYQKPCGFLKNKHMISIGAHFLQDSWDTKYDFGPPRGLFVLIMMAVSFIGYICYSLHVEVHYSMKGLPAPTRLGFTPIRVIFVPSRAIHGLRPTTTTSLRRVMNGGRAFSITMMLPSQSLRKSVISQFWMRCGGLCL